MCAQILYDVLWWQLEGNPMPLGYSSLLGIFIPKGDDPDDAPHVCTRHVFGLRPPGLENMCNKIVAGVAFRKLSQQLNIIVNPIQRRYGGKRNVGNDIAELDAHGRPCSMRQHLPAAMPLLVGYDFGRAFPSLARGWVLKVMHAMPLPLPLKTFAEFLLS
eukprot:6461983-Pyramimonas_sp.AAC.1